MLPGLCSGDPPTTVDRYPEYHMSASDPSWRRIRSTDWPTSSPTSDGPIRSNLHRQEMIAIAPLLKERGDYYSKDPLFEIMAEKYDYLRCCNHLANRRCDNLETILNRTLQPEVLVEVMLTSKDTWDATSTFAMEVLKELRQKKWVLWFRPDSWQPKEGGFSRYAHLANPTLSSGATRLLHHNSAECCRLALCCIGVVGVKRNQLVCLSVTEKPINMEIKAVDYLGELHAKYIATTLGCATRRHGHRLSDFCLATQRTLIIMDVSASNLKCGQQNNHKLRTAVSQNAAAMTRQNKQHVCLLSCGTGRINVFADLSKGTLLQKSHGTNCSQHNRCDIVRASTDKHNTSVFCRAEPEG
ncbi:hypothetical protein J6590_022705 [Homalodisca vitripennis]|nr:hypothetical protein J6590_022705 [Homalodisca vitripennis]